MSRFDDKVVLVTGAASGIGAATATLFRDEGAHVVGVDLNGDGADIVKGDVTDPTSVRAFVDEAITRHGGIDVVANVAGMVRFSHVEDTTLDDWNDHVAVNLTGPWLVSQAALPSLLERKGCIVNVASIAGLRGNPVDMLETLAYNTTKGGLVNFTRALAAEWGEHGITVNAIAPGFFPSKMTQASLERLGERIVARTPLRRVGGAEDLKGLVVLLASDASRHITGQIIAVDGGASVA